MTYNCDEISFEYVSILLELNVICYKVGLSYFWLTLVCDVIYVADIHSTFNGMCL